MSGEVGTIAKWNTSFLRNTVSLVRLVVAGSARELRNSDSVWNCKKLIGRPM